MKISAAAKEYLIEIEVRKYTPKTIRSYRNNLNLFLRFCEEDEETAEKCSLPSLSVIYHILHCRRCIGSLNLRTSRCKVFDLRH